MKPAAFDYLRAASVDDAVRALAGADGEAKILAGGQSLTPVLAMRLARPALLVDVNRIPGLGTITAREGDTVRLGALVRHTRLVQQREHPLLAEAARWIGHTAIRSRGTTGGSLAHGDPAAELPVVATALDARVHVAGPAGERVIAAEELFEGALQTSLGDDEMITAVDLPGPARWGFAELSRRRGDFGLITVVAAEVNGQWRIAIGGVAGVPHRPRDAEAVLNEGGSPSEVARAAAAGVDVADDIHATAGYRRAMTEEFVRRAVAEGLGRDAG